MIEEFYKRDHDWDVEGLARSGPGRSVNLTSKYKVLFKGKFSVLLNILLCGKVLKFVKVGHGSRLGLRKYISSEGEKVIVHSFWGSSWSRTERWIVLGKIHVKKPSWSPGNKANIIEAWNPAAKSRPYGKTEERSYSHEGVCGTQDYYIGYWDFWQHRRVG